MDIKNVIVVIAMDHRIALKAVADHYKTLADPRRSAEAIARDYLGKIIQLPVRLHQPNEREVAQFIAHDLFAVSTPSSAAPVVEPPAASGTDSKPVLDHTPQEFADTLSGTTRSDRPPSSDQETQLAAPPSAAKERAIARETDTLIAEMTDTEEELKLFQELANSHQFHNPRQLIRLRNSYRLLKILALLRQQVVGVGKIPPDPEHLMAMLFWHEFLYECPREERPRCVAFLWGELSLEEAASGATRRVLATVGQRLRTTFAMETPEEGYTSTIGFVRRLMLPHHDETIVDSRQENTPLAGHRDVAIHSDQGMVRGTDVRAHRQHPRVV